MVFEYGPQLHDVELTLYTDALVVRGRVKTRHHRITDVLNEPETHFLILSGVTTTEVGGRESATTEYAQINLDSVLFAVVDEPIEVRPELRTPKVPESALISIPPYKVAGRIHLLPERDLRAALGELTGRFLPVTEAVYWSVALGEARTAAHLVAVNHALAQVLAPYRPDDRPAAPDAARSGALEPDAAPPPADGNALEPE